MRWYRFDELNQAELYELLAFRQAIFVVEQRSPYPDLDFIDQRAAHLLLREGNGLAGCLRLIPSSAPGPLHIGRVAVAAALRRRGLARRMVAAALERCAGQPVAVSAQSWLAPFYESFGFAVTSAPYDDYGVPHVDMLKEA